MGITAAKEKFVRWSLVSVLGPSPATPRTHLNQIRSSDAYCEETDEQTTLDIVRVCELSHSAHLWQTCRQPYG